MGRGRRISYPGAFYHCINRGNRREQIFYDDQDYRQMLECLGEASLRYDVRIHGYCLIPNHFHLLIQQQELSFASAMRSLTTQYALYFNKNYGKVGHVFQGRYRGILCDKHAYLLELIRYIYLNPVRAGLVEKAQEWPWSSLSAYLGKSQNEWLYQKDVRELLGGRPDQRVLECLSQEPDLTPGQVYPVEALSIMGNREFVQEATKQGEPRRVQRRAYTGQKLPLARLAEILGGTVGMTMDELCRSHKGSLAQTELRERLVHMATRIMFYREVEVARFLRVTAAAVTMANRRYDAKLRRNPNLADALVGMLMENT